MPQEHELKLRVEYWDAIASGEKCFEVRKDDRGFQKGDFLILKKYGRDPSSTLGGFEYLKMGISENRPTSKAQADAMRFKITYILTGGKWGIEGDHVVMGIKRATK